MLDHISAEAIEKFAAQLGVLPAALRAVVLVESDGKVFEKVNGRDEPLIRWEGHYFDRLVKPELRQAARDAGLANPKAGAVKNPRSQAARYDLLARAARLDPEAAYKSISIGCGQVMGSHATALGYASATEMIARAREGFEGQLEIMCRYITEFGLKDELQRQDWSGFARGYNGPNYRKYDYHTKMAAAFARAGGEGNEAKVGMLRLGSKGAKVRELQQLLKRAGIGIEVDGDFGPTTKAAVVGFQTQVGLLPDGVVGPETYTRLSNLIVDPEVQPGQTRFVDLPEVKIGAGGAVIAASVLPQIDVLTDALVPLVGSFETIDRIYYGLKLISATAAVAGALYATYGAWKSRRTYEGLA